MDLFRNDFFSSRSHISPLERVSEPLLGSRARAPLHHLFGVSVPSLHASLSVCNQDVPLFDAFGWVWKHSKLWISCHSEEQSKDHDVNPIIPDTQKIFQNEKVLICNCY